MQLKFQAGNRNDDHQFPGLWDGRRTVLNARLQSAKSRPHQKLKMEMSLYSRSTTVIHHDSPWLIRHDTLSVRVWQSSGNRSGSGMYCMHANDLCGESGVFVIRNHHWDKPCRNIPVKTLGRPRLTREIGTEKRRLCFNHFLISDTEVRTANMECPCLPCRMVTKRWLPWLLASYIIFFFQIV